MPKVRMRDTTAHADYGQMLAGEVYEVSDEHAKHLTGVAGLARAAHADTQTYAEKQGIAAQQAPADEDEEAPTNPEIARQVAEAGTRPGDVSETNTDMTRKPISGPIQRGNH
jgi:hypothetical protein